MKIKNDKIVIQITCLIVSVILWIIIMVETNPLLDDTYTNVPVTIRNLTALENSNLILMNTDKDHMTVNIKVKGYGEQLNNISKGDFSAYIDVLGYGEGITNAKVEVVGPTGVEIVSSYPSQVACNIESVISKVMDVLVQYEGSQEKDYYRSAPTLNPSSVKVTGPRSVVDSANRAIATINIDGVTDSLTKTVPVRIYDGTDTEIFMSVPTDNVEVTVPVYPTKYVNLVPLITGEPEVGYELVNTTINPGKVKIAARKDILDSIKELNVAELDITGAYNNILSSKEIINTDGLILLDSTTPVVNAIIEEIIQKDFVFTKSDIQFIDVQEGYNVKFVNPDEEITVTVEGTSSIVNAVNKSDLIITADMSEATTGLNTVVVECVTEKSFNSIFLSKENLEVELEETTSTTENSSED